MITFHVFSSEALITQDLFPVMLPFVATNNFEPGFIFFIALFVGLNKSVPSTKRDSQFISKPGNSLPDESVTTTLTSIS